MTFDTVKKSLLDLGIDEELITENAYLHKDLELDSTETIQIALDVKRIYDVTIKLESRKDLTVGEVCALIDQARATSNAS